MMSDGCAVVFSYWDITRWQDIKDVIGRITGQAVRERGARYGCERHAVVRSRALCGALLAHRHDTWTCIVLLIQRRWHGSMTLEGCCARRRALCPHSFTRNDGRMD